jgi:hypothetical protein
MPHYCHSKVDSSFRLHLPANLSHILAGGICHRSMSNLADALALTDDVEKRSKASLSSFSPVSPCARPAVTVPID